MTGKIIVILMLVIAALAGVALWYLQLYAYYAPVAPGSPAATILLAPLDGGPGEVMPATAFEGIDANSSPLRFRACLETPLSLAMLTETFTIHPNPTPLIAPGWFTCFRAETIGADLADGTAIAFLSQADVHPGVDRVVAVYPDGRAYAWHQLNESADN